eukprot:g13959.t1
MEKKLDDLMSADEALTWPAVVLGTQWNYGKYGVAPEPFRKEQPQMVSIQGQHRLAAINAALSAELGLSLEICGDLGVDGLFPGTDNTSDPTHSEDMMRKFRKALEGMKLHAVVHDYLNHERASHHGHRVSEKHTTKHGILDIIMFEGPVIRQVANRDVDICTERASETFGKDWRSHDPKKFSKPFAILKARVKTKLERIDLLVNKQTLLTFVYAAALCPERWIVKFLLEHFAREDEKLQVYNAAAAMAARKGGPAPGRPEMLPIKEHALSVLFALNERTQKSPTIQNEITANGLSESLRHVCSVATVVELVGDMMISLATVDQAGDALVLENPLFEKYKEKLHTIKEFYTSDDLSKVDDVEGLVEEIVALANHEVVVGLLLKLGVDIARSRNIRIGRKALQAGQGRAVAAHSATKMAENPHVWSNDLCSANPNNRSFTIPKAKEQMHLSTSSVMLKWDLRQFAEWFHFPNPKQPEDAERERHVAAFCSLLLFDHILAGRGLGSGDRVDRFKKLIDVFALEAAALVKKPEIELPGGVSLFDATRLEHLSSLQNTGKPVAVAANERASPGASASSIGTSFRLNILASPDTDTNEGSKPVRVGGWVLGEDASERVLALLDDGKIKEGEDISCQIVQVLERRMPGGVSKAGGSVAARQTRRSVGRSLKPAVESMSDGDDPPIGSQESEGSADCEVAERRRWQVWCLARENAEESSNIYSTANINWKVPTGSVYKSGGIIEINTIFNAWHWGHEAYRLPSRKSGSG